jgi:hypothetical protein
LDRGKPALREMAVAHYAPKACATTHLKDTFWWFLDESWRADGATEDLTKQHGAQGLSVNLGEIAW